MPMVDPKILEATGATNERLRQIFTATPPEKDGLISEADRIAIERDYKIRQAFESDISRVLSENINFTLQNHQFFSAVDLAWDAQPINKETYPLMLYAQGKLDLGKCVQSLDALGCGDRYIKRDDKGQPSGVDLPRFVETNFNVVRSMVTRRLAAQANKYCNLYPYLKYDSRSVSQTAKLRADIMSMISDIMCDQFDYKHHDVQVMRDMMLYGHSVDFVRAAWEREVQWKRKGLSEEPEPSEKETFDSEIVREGVAWINPHPSRVFWDNEYALSSINTDTGCTYLGFWDVIRFGDVMRNTKYWNRTRIAWSSYIVQLFSTYAQYFSQYYCTITPPCDNSGTDLSSQNDRKNNVGLYSQDMTTTSMIIAQYFRKIIPAEHGLGTYPYPVWLRMVVAGYNTVIYAEFLPSSPGAYCGYNENDSRFLSLSIAHELLSCQDQMSNLLSMLLLSAKADNQKILVIDTDTLTPEQLKTFREQARGKNYYNETQVLEVSRSKMKDLGIDIEKVVELVETRSSSAPTIIFQAMTTLLQLTERLINLSPQEQGQPAPSGISATETNMIAGTTETVYGFISSSIDEFRAAKKRIIYESYMAFGNPNFQVAAMDRYPKSVIERAGFTVYDEDAEPLNSPASPMHYTVIGTKDKLVHAYIFTSRDGAERSVNTQAANVLVQLLGVLQNPIVIAAIGKDKYFEIINEIFRLSGAGLSTNLEVREGESNQIGVDPTQQFQQTVQQVLQKLTVEAEQGHQTVQQIQNQIRAVVDEISQLKPKVEAANDTAQRAGAAVSRDPVTRARAMREIQGMELDRAERTQKMTNAQQEHDHGLAIESLKAEADIAGKRRRYAVAGGR